MWVGTLSTGRSPMPKTMLKNIVDLLIELLSECNNLPNMTHLINPNLDILIHTPSSKPEHSIVIVSIQEHGMGMVIGEFGRGRR